MKIASERRTEPRFTDYKGRPTASLPLDVEVLLAQDWEKAEDWESKLEALSLRDPQYFVAGQLHSELSNWEKLLATVNNEQSKLVEKWLRYGVNVEDYFRPFKGTFKGISLDSDLPPPYVFKNYDNCGNLRDEVIIHLTEGLRSGAIELVGRVGEVPPPHLVMPLLMVQGLRKSRLVHDCRFLNLFMKPVKFSLEGLSVIPGLLEAGDYIASSDEKSAYQGVSLAQSSRKYFGVEFEGFYFQWTVLPFGWSVSPFVYQTIGMQVTSLLRLKGVITTQYLDDRFLGPLVRAIRPKIERTGLSIYYNAAVLSCTGFTIAFDKSEWFPLLRMLHLGLIMHSDTRFFEIPEAKKLSFKSVRESILDSNLVHTKLLQKLMGKCVSFSLCIPVAKMYIRAMARSISWAEKKGCLIPVVGDLKEEILFWRFLDNHDNWVKWRGERHTEISLATDASGFGWGASLSEDRVIRDFWDSNDARPIHLKEADALLKTMRSISGEVSDRRVDVWVDNQALLKAWNNKGGKDPALIEILKSLVTLLSDIHSDLRLLYIESAKNPADAPSRKISATDSKLAVSSWEKSTGLVWPSFL